jgi:hypothetical protein
MLAVSLSMVACIEDTVVFQLKKKTGTKHVSMKSCIVL